jgi:DNA replication protein DnaC
MSTDLDPLFKRLHLANARRVWRDLVRRAELEEWSYEQLLSTLISEEVAHRRGTRLHRAVRSAQLPFLRTIEEFDFSYQSTLRLMTFGSLLSPDFVTEGHSVILEGKPGRGKTHLAISIAYRAMQNGFEALFVNCAELIDDLSCASRRGELREALMRYLKPHVLVVDEVGYLAYGDDAANVLFHVVNERHIKKRAMVFTTNKSPKRWGPVLHDDDLAEAIVDRILDRGRLLRLDGPSLRTKHLAGDTSLDDDQDGIGDRRVSGTNTTEFPEPTRLLLLRALDTLERLLIDVPRVLPARLVRADLARGQGHLLVALAGLLALDLRVAARGLRGVVEVAGLLRARVRVRLEVVGAAVVREHATHGPALGRWRAALVELDRVVLVVVRRDVGPLEHALLRDLEVVRVRRLSRCSHSPRLRLRHPLPPALWSSRPRRARTDASLVPRASTTREGRTFPPAWSCPSRQGAGLLEAHVARRVAARAARQRAVLEHAALGRHGLPAPVAALAAHHRETVEVRAVRIRELLLEDHGPFRERAGPGLVDRGGLRAREHADEREVVLGAAAAVPHLDVAARVLGGKRRRRVARRAAEHSHAAERDEERDERP